MKKRSEHGELSDIFVPVDLVFKVFCCLPCCFPRMVVSLENEPTSTVTRISVIQCCCGLVIVASIKGHCAVCSSAKETRTRVESGTVKIW